MSNTDPRRHAQRQAFALAAQLRQRFNQRGITESDLWNAVKADHGVQSRSEIDELGYVRLVARLSAAKRHQILFESLCRSISEVKAI